MKNSDSIGNRNRELPVCSAEPETTAPTRVWKKYEPQVLEAIYKYILNEYNFHTGNRHYWTSCLKVTRAQILLLIIGHGE